ncbi:Phosphatidylinositol 3- and 4-kinase family protein [Coccidioides posadasii C735 delta SOWgp]|uniref:Phosphatidylinositol 3-and 4-kinase family protein n=1 Tax=Coccidioides posadasii (strain C735) TaxID=222929 RepID=C5P4I0_COCP7|nr:Phosphatidylinositol 3- and 4-kinase family protein [Coccidioides posadasii C735 delta SOWgp]EER27620.1 Phosphatidylinositol 3- and 4-kinase family protein [Coccidioides posadasii C735 delta SOWgp]|eukprot:XP_003069765.1 Phosphatidylinositol 3- and 4-kinase family protein [Coccidioides posadasii C735 delta SOWgp]
MERNIDIYAAKLADPAIESKFKTNVAVELRDSLEQLCSPPSYAIFLTKLWPVFKKILKGEPVFVSMSWEQKLRNCILEIIHRLPLDLPDVQPYAGDMVDLLMELVRVENEENAVLCMKTIMDLERRQVGATQSRVQPFLELIRDMFEGMSQVVKDTFDTPVQGSTPGMLPSTPGGPQNFQSPRPSSPATSVSDLAPDQQGNQQLLRGMQSFKVLSECPIIVVSIFQVHRALAPQHVKVFVPLIKGILLLQAKPQEKAHVEAAAQGRIFTGICKEIKNRAAFGEFITAQVKTMSFLAYLLRQYSSHLQDFLPSLPGVVVRLLQDCPREKSSARKELLVAIRHIINFNYRKIFLMKLDELLDERTLIGDGLTVYEAQRPLAYSMLADLIHHVRESLNRDQIRRTLAVYTKNLHDDIPGTSFQAMSAKLLLNMAERIAKLEDKREARYFLIAILDAIGDKFAAMNREFKNAIKASKQAKENPDGIENYLGDQHPPDWDEIDIFTATPIKTSNPRDRNADPVSDNKFLFRTLVNGLKNLFYQLRTCNPDNVKVDPSNVLVNWTEISYGYNAEEVRVIKKLFHEGAAVFRYYGVDEPEPELQYSSPLEFITSQYMQQMSKEEKELLESFGTVFHCVDPATFHEVFHSEIPYLHDLMFEHSALLHLPQFFLASEATSPAFAGMALQYLMSRIHEVGSADMKKSRILLRMFKLSFMAVTLFSAQNEQVLHPHVTKIVTKCIELSVTAEEPMNYFLLLRSLFRSIGGGRFELLYKELLPLLEMLLETFNNLLLGARKIQERDLYVELTLTVPARLSHLLPHLSHLMRPLVVALRAGSDLVGQGLRTLELCVDNLTADYLDPIMAPIMDELMTALWDHLRPNPYSHFHAHTTMRILGKLGGRNRKFLNHPPDLTFQQYADDTPSMDIKLIGSTKDRAFPLDIGIDLALGKLLKVPRSPAAKASDSFYKQQAYRMLSSQLKLYIGFENLPEDFAAYLRLQANDIIDAKFAAGIDILEKPERQYSIPKKLVQEETLKKLLKACMYATTIPELKQSASQFLADVCRHFTIIEVGRALTQARHSRRPFNVSMGEGPLYLDTRVLADSVVECYSSDNPAVRDAAKQAMFTVRDTAVIIFGSPAKIGKLPFFPHLARSFCHACHDEEWFMKAGGSLGIHLFVTDLDLGDQWLVERQAEFVRALMYVIKDTPSDFPASTRTRAQEALDLVLHRCTKGLTKDELKNDKSRLFGLCGFLVHELSHMNKHVREAARNAFKTIGRTVSAEVHELLYPVKDRLLLPIFNKPLRALPFPTQIGFIEAITFCLGLHRDIVTFNDQLNRLLMESLALADVDDESLASKPHEIKTAEQIVNLRVSCLHLLSMAMSFPDFASGPQNSSRARIIAVFFKSLYSKSPEIIEAANSGLRDVLTQTNKLGKDLLQNGLRPILMNLQDPKRLSVAGLDGLARLLTLLTNYFKIEIGARLMEHMKVIADDAVLEKVSFGLIEQSHPMKIVAAIFNIFHLLPPAATSFMENLVTRVLWLEDKLRRTANSPFRKPLIKYLNRYPKESWAFFQVRFHDERFGRFFGQILAEPESLPLRSVVVADANTFMTIAFGHTESPARNTAAINGIYAVHSICSHESTRGWLNTTPDLKRHLLNAGRDLESKLRGDKLPVNERLRVEQADDQLLEIFTVYLSQNLYDLDFLFDLIDKLSAGELKSTLAMPKFLYEHIISSDSIDYRKSIIMRCLDLYGQRNSSQKLKTYAFRNLVNPILAMDVQRTWGSTNTGPKLMDKNMTELIHNRLWKPQLGDISDESGQAGVDHSRMALLQLSALLIKYHHTTVQESRKDIIKFAWSYIRLEDIINKYGAYVLISYFIAHYETPSKIVVQIYVALLRAHQNEGKALVTQALEILAPVLPKRISSAGDARYPLWARWPRRILAEETANLQQVMSILQFLVRQPDLFYESREYFVPLIVPSLVKIAGPPNPSNESKKLALNLIGLIWTWEKRRVTDQVSGSPNPRKRKLEETRASPPGPPGPLAMRERPDYMIPLDLRTALIKYLVTFICGLPERFPVPASKLRERNSVKLQPFVLYGDMIKRAVQLLRDLLSTEFWTDLDIDLYQKVTEPILSGEKVAEKPDEKHITGMVNALQVLRVLLAAKPDEWVASRVSAVQILFEKSLRMDNPEIQDCLHGIEDEMDISPKLPPPVKRVLDSLPQEQPADDEAMDVDDAPTEFATYLSTIATESLSANNYISAINILWTLSKSRPAEMDQHIPHVMKVLSQKLAKDHVAVYASNHGSAAARNGSQEQTAPDQQEFELGVGLILKTIDLIAVRMSHLGEQRRPFLSVLAQLVERSHNIRLCSKVLGMVESWIFHSTESWPTLKEKTAVLHKMLLFEARPDQTMSKKFLELVIRIYEDPKITRTELTVRLEHAFLIGTRAQDVEMRSRFMTIFDRSLTRSASRRLSYVLTSQNWDTLADSFWLTQASQLVMGSIDMTTPAKLHPEDFTLPPASFLFGHCEKDPSKANVVVDNNLESLISEHRTFYLDIADVKARDILEPLSQLQHANPKVAYKVWVTLFTICWSALSREERIDLEKGIVTLLTKEYHQRQLDDRPNVVQALLEGVIRAKPRFKIPPHVLKFLSRTYDAWYTAAVALEQSAISPIIDTPTARESNLDALVEIYSGLQEDDMFYGTWRRRCKFVETNSALSYEQQGMWDKAQQLYESAQIKARTGAVPFSQGEYYLWEDHWVICAQKLQQWEILGDFAKHENFNDLLLESIWRSLDSWQGDANREQIETLIKGVSDAPTPRRTFFQAFMSLLKFHAKQENPQEFHNTCDEAIQLSIRKWHQLPKRITNAHIPILQIFQQLVELHDASVICSSLNQTNERNLDTKSAELKLLLGTWRDRLPNVWDDINAWQDLVTWRQHIFQLINQTYLSLLPPQTNNVASNSYAYRGYHETAWIINRFAHVARKHQMPEVCINQLSRIYTLPNIEIQEAFLKLREQAKCHYQNPKELNSGLDVINNTNLNYFGAQQKAEFFTLKGMFLAKLSHVNEANDAFGVALYYDLRLPKAWAEWGQYSDQRFKADPSDMELGSNAMSCYLEAAGLYKSHKSRKLLSRILWLLSQDNDEGKIATAFENFKGDTPVWYWITFIPQLLTSLSHREARLCKAVLGKIAKLYPQSLFFLLRTCREDLLGIKKSQDQKQEKINRLKQQQRSPQIKTENKPGSQMSDTATNPSAGVGSPRPPQANPSAPQMSSTPDVAQKEKQPWEYAEDIMAGLKTAFPLLALSMETMVDQIHKNFKCPPDEDAYRLIVALLNDGLAYVGRMPSSYAQDFKLPHSTEANITRFAETILPAHIRKSFEADFVIKKPTMYEYIHKLRRWRDKFEEKLDRRPQFQFLEAYSPHLSEFKFQKFDEVEVPGQYLEHKDKNQDFVRIDRFLPNVDLVRGIGVCHRRLKIRGHDGSLHAFAVQHPAARHCRREERMLQLFRIFNCVLRKRKESRRRNIYFHLPLMVPLAPHIRLVQDDSSYISLQGIYEDHCRQTGMNKDEPMLYTMEKMRALAENKINVSRPLHGIREVTNFTNFQQRAPDHSVILRTEIFSAIQQKWVPNTVLLDFIRQTYPQYADFWLFRRQFSYQYAAIAFMTYVMHMGNRYPSKIHISRRTGDIWSSELIPAMNNAKALFYNPEHVPFRLTPNIQTLMGPLATEGIFACAIMAIARCLTEPRLELEQQLSIFVRDELLIWAAAQQRVLPQMKDLVQSNIDFIVNRAISLASPPEGNLPANQSAIDLISKAVNPQSLAQCEALWMPYM